MIARDDFAKFMFHLRKAVPTYAPNLDDEETVRIWHQAFASRTMEELRNVYVFVRDHEKQFPSIARLRELLNASQKDKFDVLIALIGKHGSYRPPEVEDLLARAINRMGGWKRICEWENDELPFRRKEFEAIYQELSEQKQIGQLDQSSPAYLAGEHETKEAFQVSSPAKLQIAETPKEAPAPEPDHAEARWERIKQRWGDELDENISERLRLRGFFKLKTTPGFCYRYPSTKDPMADDAWPYRFVEVSEHLAQMRKINANKTDRDPNSFDSSQFDIDRMFRDEGGI